MDPYPEKFSISDLESFSGVKAHTIRAWERRYGIMKPGRSDTNIRSYDNDELRNLLNVAFLVRHGIKISKVSKLSTKEREARVQQMAEGGAGSERDLYRLQLAMLAYDSEQFVQVQSEFENREGFHALMERLYLPLLQRIGLLWQSDSIRAGQEHMASNLIRQRIIAATATQEYAPDPDSPLCVLYLPEQEMHELGLLYLNYLLRSQGHRTLYLGQGVPQGDLQGIAQRSATPVHFIGIYSCVPLADDVKRTVNKLRELIPQGNVDFILTGARMLAMSGERLPAGVAVATDIREVPALLKRA